MMLPFQMRTETPMEKYRAETFWEKEPETIAWLRYINSHGVFFDVGANIGVYSLYAASLYPGMKIVAFEPMHENWMALSYNINLNGFQNVIIWPDAVGDHRGWSNFSGNGEAGISGGQVGGPGGLVMVIPLDDVPLRPTHVKIDIDGQELSVVRGMQLTLPHIKSALIEVSRASRGPIMDIMTRAGFTTRNRFNEMTPHSRGRREREGIDAENIVFTR